MAVAKTSLKPFIKNGTRDWILGDGILRLLRATGGIIWPYTPVINYNPSSEYAKYDPVHTNTDYMVFSRNPAQQIQVSGNFTSQNAQQAAYGLACLHFLKTFSKMRFGDSEDVGSPPPMLIFDAYGYYMFNKVPVILTNFSMTYDQNVDYVPIDTREFSDQENILSTVNTVIGKHTSDVCWMPTNYQLSVSLNVQILPETWRKEFSLDKFRKGELLRGSNNGGWV